MMDTQFKTHIWRMSNEKLVGLYRMMLKNDAMWNAGKMVIIAARKGLAKMEIEKQKRQLEIIEREIMHRLQTGDGRGR
jgi:hypothetical protein